MLEVPLRPAAVILYFTFKRVSILVLLEVPLRPYYVYRYIGDDDVSILVLLEVPLRLKVILYEKYDTQKFQSLFCWKFLLGYALRKTSDGWS